MSPLPTATEQNRERVAKRGPRLPELGSVAALPDYAAGLAPPAVKTASAEFATALDKLAEARSAVHEAKAAIKDADWRDREEARKAADNGKPPKKATSPAARQAVEEAERLVPAAEWQAREKQAAFLAAVREHREEITSAAESRLRTVEGEARALVAQLEAALLRRDELTHLLSELSGPVGEGRHPTFNPRERSRLGRDRTEALAALRVNEAV